MRQKLDSIRDGIENNVYTNEASVSQGIVLNLLSELGWDTSDVGAVSPEYSVKGRRVDYALCYPRNRPRIFIEVKQVGKSALDFEEQLSAYAYEEGVPLVVLTTGKEWNFYVPYGPGRFEDRRVYRIDLLQRSVDEIIDRLNRYLSLESVRSGTFITSAQNDLQEVLSDQETQRQLPKVWHSVLNEPAPELVELVLQRLETITGDAPRIGIVEKYIREQLFRVSNSSPKQESDHVRRSTPTNHPPNNLNGAGHFQLIFLGQSMSFRTHRDRLIKVFQLLNEQDDRFFERYWSHAKPGQRPGIARNPPDLFPTNKSLANTKSHFTEILHGSGWYIDLNRSGDNMVAMIRRACQIAELRFGIDVIVK